MSTDHSQGFPSVRRLLNSYNVDPSSVKGTGPQGRLLKGDVLQCALSLCIFRSSKLRYVEKNNLTPTPKSFAKSARTAKAETVTPKKTAEVPKKADPTKPAPVASSSQDYVDRPASTMRQVIAKRLTESKTQVMRAIFCLSFVFTRIRFRIDMFHARCSSPI